MKKEDVWLQAHPTYANCEMIPPGDRIRDGMGDAWRSMWNIERMSFNMVLNTKNWCEMMWQTPQLLENGMTWCDYPTNGI